MKYLAIIVLTFSASILFFASCEDCTEIYKTTGMDVRPINDSLEVSVPVDTNATVSYKNLLFYIVFDWDYEHFCPDGTEKEKRFSSSIKSFTITSNQEYNSKFQAGKELNSIIEISHSELGGFGYLELFPLNEYMGADGNCHMKFRLYLTEPPDTTRQHQFTVDYVEENGQSYQFTTHPFYITP